MIFFSKFEVRSLKFRPRSGLLRPGPAARSDRTHRRRRGWQAAASGTANTSSRGAATRRPGWTALPSWTAAAVTASRSRLAWLRRLAAHASHHQRRVELPEIVLLLAVVDPN